MLPDNTYHHLMEMWRQLEKKNPYNTKYLADTYMLPFVYILYPHVQDMAIIRHILIKTFAIAEERMSAFNTNQDTPFQWLLLILLEYLKSKPKRRPYYYRLYGMMQQLKYP